MSELRFELPIPPSVNHLYRTFTNKQGRRIRVHTADAKKWFSHAGWPIKDAINRSRWKPLDEKCVVDLWVWWPDRHTRDCDNLNKALMDALKMYDVVTDDHFCLPRWQDYDYDKLRPRVEVCVWKQVGSPTTGGTSTRETVAS